MRRYLTLVLLLVLAIPAGVSISGCTRNPAGNYCNGLGYGLKVTQVFSIDLEPRTTGISIAFGQTRQITAPTAKTCKGASASVSSYTYGTTNNRLVDLSPTGNICAGNWNRNSGGGIADFTICSPPNPTPSSGGLPFSTAFITAAADSVTSNPVQVYVHAPVSSINLTLSGQTPGQQQCFSQTTVAPLDSEACFASGGQQYELCAPPSVTKFACSGGLPPGVTSVPDCSTAVGVASYTVGTPSVATINSETNQITAQLPGTTAITASIAGSGSSAGFFSTCAPKSITVTLANGATTGTVTQGVQQSLTTTVIDTNGNPITGLALDYQSTNPLDINAGATGGITANFPGAASIYAICQPTTCNPSPINQIGAGNGTGLSISSNAVDVTVPGTASSFVWYSAPGQSQYFVPIELLTGTVASTVRLPYVPNSMVMDQTGANLYFGSSHELMVYATASNSLSRQDTTVPGKVLAVAPNNQTLLINDQVRQVFYVYAATGTVSATFGGVGTSAAWTPDSKTLYITDTAASGPGHSNTLYVYNANTGWTTCSAGQPCAQDYAGAANLTLTIPGVGAYFTGATTEARTWCPSGTVGNYNSMVFYPQGDALVGTETDALAATTDGAHIIGAALGGGGITLSDIGVTIPTTTGTNGIQTPAQCAATSAGVLSPLNLTHTLAQAPVTVNATSVNQVVTSPAAVVQGTAVAPYSLSFITYNGTTAGASLPYYKQVTGATTALGTVGYVTLNGASAVTAPVAGAFSPDASLFFVSTSGDNQIHYINTTTLTDTQQISPNLPACAPGSDPDCTITTPQSAPVPATAIAVKPRSTT
jgi:trimeric autotransporter adhesin